MRPLSLSLLAGAAALVLAGCAVIVVPGDGGESHVETVFGGSGVQGNGEMRLERRQVAALERLEVSGPLRVEVRVGGAPSLEVEADSNLLPLIRTEGSGDTLHIGIDGSIRTHGTLRVVYTTPALSHVNASGSGRLLVSGLNGGAFTIDQSGSRATQLSGTVSRLDVHVHGSGGVDASGLASGSTLAEVNGSGRLELGRIQGDTLDLTVSGSGGARASGDVHALNVRVHGSGSADLAALHSEGADLNSSGSGGITAAVSNRLAAESNGSGRITVYGNPARRDIVGKHVSVIE
jgi:hypothetical protein